MRYIIIAVLFGFIIYTLNSNVETFKTIKCPTLEAPSDFKRGSIGDWKKNCVGKTKCNDLTVKCNNQIENEGGVVETHGEDSFCFSSQLKDIFLVVLFPPLWIIVKEANSPVPFKNAMRIVVSLVLTSCFYFPGLIHAMNIMRHDGPI
tara:strand:+ start:1346 stop:1789 length:444 start_codon:yes stop_codon:yes gene_type:complete